MARFSGCADAGMRSTTAGAFLSAPAGVASAMTAGVGATTVFGCSDCAEGRAQPRKNVRPATNPRLQCRTKFVFIRIFFVAPDTLLAIVSRLNIHYRLALFIGYSGW